jgi:hypothetical protein
LLNVAFKPVIQIKDQIGGTSMQSVLKKVAFGAGALALGVGLSACGKLKDMPSSGKQSQTEAPATAVIPTSFQGVWSHAYHVYPPNEKDGTPQDGENHFKLAADGTLSQLESFQVSGTGNSSQRVSLKYKVVGKVAMRTPHSADLDARGEYLQKLQDLAVRIGVWNPSFEVVRVTHYKTPQLCVLAWEDDRGGALEGSAEDDSEDQCFERFSLAQMENYLKDKAKQGAGH